MTTTETSDGPGAEAVEESEQSESALIIQLRRLEGRQQEHRMAKKRLVGMPGLQEIVFWLLAIILFGLILGTWIGAFAGRFS